MSVPHVDPIPDGWEMRLDEMTKTYYFIDHKNQRTQWQHPINKLIYRPAHSQPQVALNGNQATPIAINRQPILSTKNMCSHFQPSPAPNETSPTISTPLVVQRPTSSEEQTQLSNSQEKLEEEDSGITLITKVLGKARPVIEEVDAFKGTVGDKNYLRLMETLEVLILELDGIGIDGQDNVRAARRAAVREIQQAIEILEFRSSVNTAEDTSTSAVAGEAPPPSSSPPKESDA
ncbi:BCL2 associated athanolocus tag 3 [Echinococcus multilocularis]|uniref:BCL2 associated athanolocus tag 3 n=1 Tax=Echinococcus multilocularis TaxID=6211 RepID=A0A068YCN0_ECHMU|nr:BCL2 associated athanolocus tag 3 [Echinococcus multilocularis]